MEESIDKIENPFKIIQGINAYASKYDSCDRNVIFLSQSISSLNPKSNECVFVPSDVITEMELYRYINKAKRQLMHQDEFKMLKLKVNKLKSEDGTYKGARVFRVS